MKQFVISLVFSVVCLVATCAQSADVASSTPVEGDWTQFRGPGGQGDVGHVVLPLRWSETEGIKWKTALPGRGWSSPVIADGKIWLTTAVELPPTASQLEETRQKLASNPSGGDMGAAGSIDLLALEVDLATGQLLRTVKLFTVDEPPPIHNLNSYSSPTPVLIDGRLICHFGAFGVAGVDVKSGEVLWRKQLEIDHIVGPGSSPVVAGDVVLLTCDGADKQFVAALDVKTGETRWQVERPPIREENPDMRKSFCTPLVFDHAGRTHAVIPGAQWFISYDPATGDEIWRVDHGSGFSNVPRPVFDGEKVYLCTGFGKPQLWAVRADGVGDVSDTHVDWRQKQQIPSMSSPVVSQGRIYVISDGGVASCFDTSTGDLIWRERIPGKYSASPLLADGRIYFCSQEGRTTVIKDAAEYQELAANQLDGMHMASPAVTGNDLILRTDSNLYRVSAE
ncbi:MAG: PQQ-binding-like beta-propeller repeat protein [Planctomycetaceae bacterium]|nr:PQQ-binding-like beta-propeller repeat protein [Planctomycetaceae bacterium]